MSARTLGADSAIGTPFGSEAVFSAPIASRVDGAMGGNMTSWTYGDLDTVLGLENTGLAHVQVDLTKPVQGNHVEAIQDLYRNRVIPKISVVLDEILAIRQAIPLLGIVGPFQMTRERNFTFKMISFNTLPAHRTVPGDQARTNSYEEFSYQATTRTYAIQAMLPADILFDPLDSEKRLAQIGMQMGFSLSYALIQQVVLFFITNGILTNYILNQAYYFNDSGNHQQTDTELMAATHRRDVGLVNDGIPALFRRLTDIAQVLKHRDNDRTTYLIAPLELMVAMTSHMTLEMITDFNTYMQYQQDSRTLPTVGIKRTSEVPLDPSRAYRVPGTEIVIIIVPALPTSFVTYLPNLLRSYAPLSQFYFWPQYARTEEFDAQSAALSSQLGIYDGPGDDIAWISYKQRLCNSQIYAPNSDKLSDLFLEAVGRTKHLEITTKDSDGLRRVRNLTPTARDFIRDPTVVKPMTLVCWNRFINDYQIAKNIGADDEANTPTSVCIEASQRLIKYFPATTHAIMEVVTYINNVLDATMTKEQAAALITANEARLNSAGPTFWINDKNREHFTYNACSRDVGKLNWNGHRSLAGRGHSLHDLSGLVENVPTYSAAIKAFTTLEQMISRTPIVHSDVFKKGPAWVNNGLKAITGLASNICGGYPLFAKSKQGKVGVVYETHEAIAKSLARGTKRSAAYLTFAARQQIYKFIQSQPSSQKKKVTPLPIDLLTLKIDYILSYLPLLADIGKMDTEVAKLAGQFDTEIADQARKDQIKLELYGGDETLEGYSTIATILAKTDGSDYSAWIDELRRSPTTAIDKIKREFPGVEDVLQADETVWVRTCAVMSRRALEICGAEISQSFVPGDYKTGFATPVPADWHTNLNAYLAPETNQAEELKRALATAGTAANKGDDDDNDDDPTKKASASASAAATSILDAPAGRRLPKALSRKLTFGGASSDPTHMGIFQSTQMPSSFVDRLSYIMDNIWDGLMNDQQLMLLIYLAMPTTCSALGAIGDAGIDTPLVVGCWRTMIFEALNLPFVAGGCGQVVFNPSKLTQLDAGYNNEFRWKAEMTMAVILRMIKSTSVIMSGLITQCIYGMNTVFELPTDPGTPKNLTINSEGGSVSDPCLKAFAIAHTDALNDAFCLNGKRTPTQDELNICQAKGATGCPSPPANIKFFYSEIYHEVDQHIQAVNDARLQVVRDYYYYDKGRVPMMDNDACARVLSTTQLQDDVVFRGPIQIREGGNKRDKIGAGPLSQTRHQRRGSKQVYGGDEFYFSREVPQAAV